jgi:hypothetical protein
VILVDVEACPGSVVSVLSDEAVDGADADTLLTTDETMERSTGHNHQPLLKSQLLDASSPLHVLFSCKASSLGSVAVFSSKSA